MNDGRLPEFSFLEAGLVDALALHVANEQEVIFMEDHPEYRPETNSENSLSGGPLMRNTLAVITVLYELLNVRLSEIMMSGEHLG